MRAPLALLACAALALLAGCSVPNYAFDGAVRRDAAQDADGGFDGDAPHAPCTVAMCGDRCTDISTDPDHCGTCDTRCPSLPNTVRRCAFGRCLLPCAPRFDDCDGDLDNGCEADVTNSEEHCGRCRNRCPEGAGLTPLCERGACTTGCAPGLGDCDGDLDNGCETDVNRAGLHCGTCGNACTSGRGQTANCVAGRCQTACLPGLGDCDGIPENGCETSLDGSALHCGMCARPCPAMRLCSAGTCVETCPVGQSICGTGCANLLTDRENCGLCGVRCAPTNAVGTCVAGTCAQTCNAGFGDCDGNLGNGCEQGTQTSVTHCGACNIACPAGANSTATCMAGRCGIACAPGFGDCDGLAINGCEVNLLTSTVHCGACNATCAARPNAAPVCNGAAGCGLACIGSALDCNADPADGCETDPRTSTTHCGRCGTACSAGQVCSDGVCASACPAGQTLCGSECATLTADPDNCLACGMRCPAGANATAACSASGCGLGCTLGFSNCDANPANGCETSTATSVSNCGTCGTNCPVPMNSAARCTAGTCGSMCNPGFADCNSAANDGCEINTSNNQNHCGACGTVCSTAGGTASCVSGVCAIACNPGLGNCDGDPADGCESTLASDNANCGVCGRACLGGQTCTQGLCCGVGSQICGGVCVNTESNRNHCGECNHICPSRSVCDAGSCTIVDP